MTRYAIALGSNLGDRVDHLRRALDLIGGLGEGLTVSGLYETAPIGGPEQGPYLNAVVALECELAPDRLLRDLQQIEADQGRARLERWGPRTLDLDIVAMSPGTASTPGLEIPHPRARERRFVLEPLSEIWPDAMVAPGVTAGQALAGVGDQEVDLLARQWSGGRDGRYGVYWVLAQLVLFALIAVALVLDGSLPFAVGDLGSDAGGWDAWTLVGAVLLVGGGGVLWAAVRALGEALTPLPEPVSGATLVESGPYRRVRHPIYAAVVMAMVGASLLLASTAATVLSVALLVFFWAKSGYEERQLRIAYSGYSAYMTRVRHRLIPFLL